MYDCKCQKLKLKLTNGNVVSNNSMNVMVIKKNIFARTMMINSIIKKGDIILYLEYIL